MSRLVQIYHLIRKEFRQIFRERAMIGIIFVAPLLQLLVFGYAVTTDLRNVRLAVLDQDRTPQSRDLVTAFLKSGYFSAVPSAANPAELEQMLLDGRADMTLHLPRGYAKALSRGEHASVGIQVDGSNSSIAGLARGYAEAIVRQEALRLMDEKLAQHPQIAAQIRLVDPRPRYFYNPELESRYYMIPGIVVLILTIISGMLTGMAVVREREVGTLEQLLVSPLTPLQLIAGKTLPFAILAFVELGVAITAAVLWFKLPLVGSIPLLMGSALVYLLVTLGVGLLASTVSQTQQQAMFTVWFFLVFGILMSGFFFPIDNMPTVIRQLTYLNPLRYFMSIVRGLFLKGATLPDVLPDLLPLAGLGVVIFTTAVLRFRKKVG